MQLLVRGPDARTHVVQAEDAATVWDVKQQLQVAAGVPAAAQVLHFGGRQLSSAETLAAAGLHQDASLSLTLPLAGGAPVQVQLLPDGLACGKSVTINVEEATPLLEVKRQLLLATGVPIEHQKVMLSGIHQLVMGDKRRMSFAHCGTASSLYFAVAAAKKQQQQE